MARDETAWTWWTLPPAIAGRVAQKYRQRTGVALAQLEHALTPE
jgi:hypothetical protein